MKDLKDFSFGFLDNIIEEDLESGAIKKIKTRFPPEPNGFLHIGHAKAICVNFGLAEKYQGTCNLRFDDTNPSKEKTDYVEAIKEDIQWLGFDWEDREYYASSYFQQMYEAARSLIEKGKAYVCDLNAVEIREYRGTLTTPGKNSPFRDRSVEENLKLFSEMKDGLHDEGSKILRAKIDMASPNFNLRDPAIYRIMKKEHHNTGGRWCIYPMYDFAHPLEDAFEGITHSFCSLEFEDHRPLYDWVLESLDFENRPKQREFARLNINYTVMSKRKLLELVDQGLVSGWDDPRLPTIRGLRRRGYPKEALRSFVLGVGVAKSNSTVDIKQLEACAREELNFSAKRVMAVIDPLKVIVTNFEEGKVLELKGDINPEQMDLGKRSLPFTRELYIEKSDFMLEPVKGFRRLFKGNEVRFKDAFYLKCTDYKLNSKGEVEEVYCTYDPESVGGWSNDGRKVKGTIHWVSAEKCLEGEVRLYDNLFTTANPEEGDYKDHLNHDSLIVQKVYFEPGLRNSQAEEVYQFLRLGYFALDKDSKEGFKVFNRVVSLKESFKVEK